MGVYMVLVLWKYLADLLQPMKLPVDNLGEFDSILRVNSNSRQRYSKFQNAYRYFCVLSDDEVLW